MRTVSIIAASLLLVACGNSDNDENANLWQVSIASASTAPLTQVSGQPLASYLKNGLYAQADVSGGSIGMPPPASPVSSAVSTTNLITPGVDEADRVKFAEQTLYVSAWQQDANEPYVKRWLRNDDSSLTALDPLALAPQVRHVQGLYASGEQLTVLGVNYYDYPFFSPGWGGDGSEVIVQLFEQGSSVYHLQFDGTLIDSRRTADALWLVSRYRPEVAGYQPYAATVADKKKNMQVLGNARLTDLLPTLRLNNGASEPLIASQQCYLPADMQADEGSAQMVVLTRIATTAPYQTESSCILASVREMYMSAEHLYLHGSVYDDVSSKTVVHKFSLDDAVAGYQATGAVDGYIGGSQSAFMLYEKQQYLMLFTTTWDTAGPEHQLVVLQQDADKLKVVAQLPNDQQPDVKIGKPGEDIYGVRFAGDRAYVVTFERIDPLYTLDISNPLQPAIIGELEIPGYSAYLHSINDSFLWGLGQHVELDEQGWPVWETAGAKIALFDVSGNDAVVQHELVFTEQFAPLEYQHHSLAAVQHDNVTRMALPLSRFSPQLGEQVSLLTLEVGSNGAMDKIGELVPEYSSYVSAWDARTVLVNDDIYFVAGDTVFHSNWQLPEQVIARY